MDTIKHGMVSRSKLLIVPFAVATLVVVASVAVLAHADYHHSEPPAGAVIPEAPEIVHVWFTQELFRREGENRLEVYGPDGARVDNEDAYIDDDDRTHMTVTLQSALPAGAYTVEWRTLSAEDGDTDSGEFTFTVDPSVTQMTPPPSPTATATAVAPATEPPNPTPTPATSGQPGSGLPCLGGGALGTLLLAVAVFVRRRPEGAVQ